MAEQCPLGELCLAQDVSRASEGHDDLWADDAIRRSLGRVLPRSHQDLRPGPGAFSPRRAAPELASDSAALEGWVQR